MRDNQDTSSLLDLNLGVLENVVYGTCRGTPSLFFDAELPAPFGRDLVRTRAAVMFRRNLACSYPAGLLHSMEGRIERALLDAQSIGEALNVRGDSIAVQWTTTRKNREYEQWQ
jgi:hypothetical protein